MISLVQSIPFDTKRTSLSEPLRSERLQHPLPPSMDAKLSALIVKDTLSRIRLSWDELHPLLGCCGGVTALSFGGESKKPQHQSLSAPPHRDYPHHPHHHHHDPQHPHHKSLGIGFSGRRVASVSQSMLSTHTRDAAALEGDPFHGKLLGPIFLFGPSQLLPSAFWHTKAWEKEPAYPSTFSGGS